ncbi:MAG: hypothetical protein M3256_07060 [Actinomycetota bacterium]|nr:hypothetical protein [Actinomycetota bacterium]
MGVYRLDCLGRGDSFGGLILEAEQPEDRAAIYELAYLEGIRVLEGQARTLEQLRVRVAAVLATATTASAFLVGIVAKANGTDKDGWYWSACAWPWRRMSPS